MKQLLLLNFLLTFLYFALPAVCEETKPFQCRSPFISGKISLRSGDEYCGIFRLGNNDLLWSNLFLAKLAFNPNSAIIPDEIRKKSKNYSKPSVKWIVGIPFRDTCPKKFYPDFVCDYGQIFKIILGKKTDLLVLKNQDTISITKNSGALAFDVFIQFGNEIKKIRWKNISCIEFNIESDYSPEKNALLLYGELKSEKLTETGFIEWDKQEKTSYDFLNGNYSKGSFSIPFNQITEITKSANGCLLQLKSGSAFKAGADYLELFRDLSCDIGPENRGIVLNKDSVGKICIQWKNFKQVRFFEKRWINTGMKPEIYFPYPEKLCGVIKTKDGKTYHGKFAYNIYKEININYLAGFDQEDLYYLIPFWNIRKIEPLNEFQTKIQFKNKSKIILCN